MEISKIITHQKGCLENGFIELGEIHAHEDGKDYQFAFDNYHGHFNIRINAHHCIGVLSSVGERAIYLENEDLIESLKLLVSLG